MRLDIQEILSRFKFTRKSKTENKTDTLNAQSGGKLYTLWLFVLPLIGGLVLGRLADVGLGYAFESLAGTGGMTDASVTGSQAVSDTNTAKRGLDGFLTTNPFHISPLKPVVAEAPKPVVEEKPKAPPDTTMDDIILRGTLPGVGAWFENKGNLSLLLVGKTLGRYRLASVSYRDATFRRGRERITKYISYGPVAEKKPEPAPAPAPEPKPAPRNQNNTGDVVAAMPGSQEGQISSELVNQLVQNPFDELKRIRMRPSEKAGGLEVQWIQNDSILKRLGVQRGDVIRSVNGIPFTNMGDIANSINSLMNSERFDVEVTRGGKAEALRYVVR